MEEERVADRDADLGLLAFEVETLNDDQEPRPLSVYEAANVEDALVALKERQRELEDGS